MGREFQSVGADAINDRSPYECMLTEYTERRFWDDERSVRTGVYWLMSSDMYEGERLFCALKHIISIFEKHTFIYRQPVKFL